MTAVGGNEENTAKRAYATLEALSRLLQATPQTHVPAFLPLCHLTLRAVLHPALAPYLRDPLLPLDGEYVSLDARASGIVGFLRESPLSRALLSDWPASDCDLLALAAGPKDTTPAATTTPQAMVGRIEGALYLSGANKAAPCRVWAACDMAAPVQTTWPRPLSLRPVSDAVAESAQNALAAAVAFLEETGLPPRLRPIPVYYDVCLVGGEFTGGDAQVGAVGGDSLGLPLALAFLSALLSAPLPPYMGATGALGKGDDPAAVFPVRWVEEKARALFAVWKENRQSVFFAPPFSAFPAMPFVRETATIGGAAHALFPNALPTPALAFPSDAAAHTAAFVATLGNADALDSETVHVASILVRRALEAHGGALFARWHNENAAEILCAATFPDADSTCAAALAAQQAVFCHLWPGDAAPSLQVGIHAYRTAREVDFAVPRAAQIARSASGGQILLSGEVRAALQTQPTGVRIAFQGSHRLADLLLPLPLFQMSAFGPDAFAPPQTLDTYPHNLPVLTTPLVGRAAETSNTARLVQSAGVSLVTLTGAAGVGKTRLALDVAARCSNNSFPGGVWFVSLMSSETRNEAAGAIAEALRLSSDAPGEVTTALAHRAPALLLLDTGEAVSPGASAFIAQVRRAAPSTTILLTARSPLRTPGEAVVPVSPLSLDNAVRFFEQRVQQHQPDFSADADADTVQEICQHTAGLPLALELAAAQTPHLSLAEIAARLSRESGRNGRQVARQTLESLVAFLPEAQQELLARLSVFADGFTTPAAMALNTENDRDDVADALLALEDAALVQRRSASDDDAQTRYFLLPVVRAFAARRLAVFPLEEKAAREAQARYFQGSAASLLGMDETGAEATLLDALALDRENLRLAQSWLQDNDPASLPGFVQALIPFLRGRNYHREENDWLLAALLAADAPTANVPPRVRAWLHMDRATYCLDNAAPGGEMEYHLQAAERFAREAHFPLMRANVQTTRGVAAARMGDWEVARPALEEARDLHHEHGSAGGEAGAWNNLGRVYAETGDKARAQRCYGEAATLCHRAQDKRGLALALNSLGYLAALDGDLETARARFVEVLDLAHETKNAFHIAVALLNLGDVEEQSGEIEMAVPLLALAETIFARLGHPHFHEAGKYLARAVGAFTPETLAYLRRDWARRPLSYLLRLDPRPVLRNV